MADTPDTTASESASRALAAYGVGYAAVMVLSGAALVFWLDPFDMRRFALALLAVECLGIAVGVPFLTAAVRQRRSAWRRIGLVLRPVYTVGILAVLACGAAPRASGLLTQMIGAQLFLLAFAGLLAAVVSLAARLRARASTAQLAATAVALAMLGNVFFANAAIEATPRGPARTRAVQAVLWTNPWLIASGSLLEGDPIRTERLYARSVISYYSFTYPLARLGLVRRTLGVCGAYLGAALLLWGVACALSRLRRPQPAPRA